MRTLSMWRKALLTGALSLTLASPAWADSFVNGYTRRDGTYVTPHHRSSPDGNFRNNWSTRGNVNPYTGQSGTRNSPSQSFPSYRTRSFPSTPSWSSPTYRSRW
jgi:hypothetical protein